MITLTSIAKAAAVATALAAAPIAAGSAAASHLDSARYRVVDVKGSHMLNLRRGPTIFSRVVAEIPFNERGLVATGRRFGQWIEIEYLVDDPFAGHYKGWVSLRYLDRDDVRRPTLYRVVDVPRFRGLDVHKRPGDHWRVVGTIPADAGGIQSRGDCTDGWCPIRYFGKNGRLEGYVRQEHLAVERIFTTQDDRLARHDEPTLDDETWLSDDLDDRRERWQHFWRRVLVGERAGEDEIN